MEVHFILDYLICHVAFLGACAAPDIGEDPSNDDRENIRLDANVSIIDDAGVNDSEIVELNMSEEEICLGPNDLGLDTDRDGINDEIDDYVCCSGGILTRDDIAHRIVELIGQDRCEGLEDVYIDDIYLNYHIDDIIQVSIAKPLI